MHQVFFGDEVTRWRCMQCDLIYSSVEWLAGDGEIVKMGHWRRGKRPKQAAAREGEIVSEIPGRGIYVMFDAKEVMEATKRKMKKFGMLESEGKEG